MFVGFHVVGETKFDTPFGGIFAPDSEAHGFCPDGWDAAGVVDEVHLASLTCERDDVTVILNPDGTFSVAGTVAGTFYETAPEVPGWLE